MNKEKTELLYTLGEADYSASSDWLDYLHYGFDQTDIADLIVLSLDKKLHFADGDAMWVPIHAWRILGQLKSEAAVQPLISIFDLLAEQDDDFSLADLPHVMGMIGPAAILPLASFINDKTHHEFAQTMAMDGLGKIAQKYPEMRDEVLTCFQRYMAMPANAEDKLINGFLTSYLLDLQATELIEDIRSLFEQDCIDLSIVGDIEDVEMALGLRDERATPALSFAERLGIPAEMLEGEVSEQIKALLDGTADTKPENDSEAVAMLDYYWD